MSVTHVKRPGGKFNLAYCGKSNAGKLWINARTFVALGEAQREEMSTCRECARMYDISTDPITTRIKQQLKARLVAIVKNGKMVKFVALGWFFIVLGGPNGFQASPIFASKQACEDVATILDGARNIDNVRTFEKILGCFQGEGNG